ncbi:hypothetical protein C7271_19480 [filamentous cyanobacterium CCP5]|nr:hypothetical protein C7271_19480 [filamentous cyanobacterium CCP5]
MNRPDSAAPQALAPLAQPCELERSLVATILLNALWLVGIPACLFGLLDRGAVLVTGDSMVVTDVSYFLIASLLFASWLCFRPGGRLRSPSRLAESAPELPLVASQIHRLPFPYTSQIYHLLNLKHLEHIHSFSLGNLRVVEVSHLTPTQSGGRLRFKTQLDSPFNVLRLWRRASVDVDLVLHTPYQVELTIPAYANKKIAVLFSVLPQGDREHYLQIQMHSNLGWPPMVLRGILLLAASFTLLEDLPYLRQLSERNLAIAGLGQSSHQSMQLFQRYVDLYGSRLDQLAEFALPPFDLPVRPVTRSWWCSELLQPLILGSIQ